MRRLCHRILASLDIDPAGFAALVRAFVLMDLRGQHYARATASQPSAVLSPLFWVIGQCVTLSAGLSLVLFARVDVFFFVFANLSVSLLVLASTLLVEFSEVVLGPADLDVLGHRPIAPRTYAAARLANLLFYVGLMYLALNVFPLVLGAGLRDAGWGYVPAYLLASLAGSLAVTCLVIWVLSAGGRSRRLEPMKDLFAWTQILLLLVLAYGGQLMFRDRTQAVLFWAAFPPSWVAYLPSAWLARFVEAVHEPQESTGWFVLALLAVSLLACGLTFARLVELYRTMQPELFAGRARPMKADRIGRVGGPALAWLLPRRAERIGFWLCRTLLVREVGLKMRGLWPLNMAAAVVVLGLATGQFANPLQESELRTIALPALAIYLTALAVVGIMHNLCFSRQHQASWLLCAAPLPDPSGVARGVCKAVMLLIVAPVCVLLGLIAAAAWQDPVAAVLHAGLAWALSWPLALTALWLVVPAAPFSLPPVHGGSTGPVALPLAVLSGGVVLGTSLHCLCAASPWYWAIAFLVCFTASTLVGRQADRRMNQLYGRPA